MPYLLIRLKCEDYAKWKPVFDGNGDVRKASGSKGGHLFRNADDFNEVVVLLEWDNLDNARKFTQSDNLRKAMERSGVSDKPDIYFLDEVERPSV